MSLDELINRLSESMLSSVEVDEAAATCELSPLSLFDKVADDVGRGYLQGKYLWEFGDRVMNSLFATAYVNTDVGLSDFASHIFTAFDEGEYIRAEPSRW